jgi:hypothetical protein
MRIIAFITQASVIDQILTHLRTRATTGAPDGARSPPSTRAPATRGRHDRRRHPRPPSTRADRPTRPRLRSRGRVACAAVPLGHRIGAHPPRAPRQGHGTGRPARRAGAPNPAPPPARRSSRGGAPRRILDQPRLNFLSRMRAWCRLGYLFVGSR